MRLLGRVVNTLPLESPSRAVIQLKDWPQSIEVPMGDLRYGMLVELEIREVKVRAVGATRLPILSPVEL